MASMIEAVLAAADEASAVIGFRSEHPARVWRAR